MAAVAEARASGSREFRISGFVVRRTLALAYCAAFLSLAAQADGLFGCDGVFPPKSGQHLARLPKGVPPSVVLGGLALAGAGLAGAAFAAVGPFERYATYTFAILWSLWAGCVGLAPALYPRLEDRLLLEAGLVVGVFISSGEGGAGIGRSLAAWVLFRAVFAGGADKATGPCSAWRDLTALGELYQLTVFPLPPVWLLWLAPSALAKALTCLQLYAEFALSPLILAPWRSIVVAATIAQLGNILAGTLFSNQGYATICLVTLAFAALDDAWHSAVWSEQMLLSWGCHPLEEEEEEEEEEEQEEQEEESEKKEEEDEQDEGKGKKAENGEEGGGSRVWWVLLLIAVAYAACLAAVLQLPTSTGGLAFLAADRGGAALLVAVAVVTAGLSASGLAVEAKRLAAARPGVGVVLAAVGGALWLAGLLQLSLDLGLQTLPTPLGAVVRGFESYRAVHSLSARRVGEAVPCPHAGGRADITFQGAFDPTTLGRPSAGAVYLDLSSRFLPAKEESRPVWLQPYTPRLDQELWRFAQLPRNQSKALPKWALRLLRGLYLRQGGAARLSNGAWRGPAAALHGGLNTDYAKVTPPLLAVRAVWRRSSMVADVHSNKWWNRTEVRIMKELVGEDAEAAMKPLKPRCEVAPALLAEAPLVEAMLALIAAVFLWKLLMSGSA